MNQESLVGLTKSGLLESERDRVYSRLVFSLSDMESVSMWLPAATQGRTNVCEMGRLMIHKYSQKAIAWEM